MNEFNFQGGLKVGGKGGVWVKTIFKEGRKMKKGQRKICKLALFLVVMLFTFSSFAQAAQLSNKTVSIKAASLPKLERKLPIALKSNKISAQILNPKTLFNQNKLATQKNGIVSQNKLSTQILSPKSLLKQDLSLKAQRQVVAPAPRPAARPTSRIK